MLSQQWWLHTLPRNDRLETELHAKFAAIALSPEFTETCMTIPDVQLPTT